jgi:hypothetical protein
MMLSRLYRHGEIGTILVCANPCSVQSDLGRHAEGIRALFLNEVNPRLPRFWLRQRVLGFVQLHVEADFLGAAGSNSGRWYLGKCGYGKNHK